MTHTRRTRPMSSRAGSLLAVVSLVLTTAFMLFCVWASAKVFRIGILSHGQAPTFRRLIVWVFSK